MIRLNTQEPGFAAAFDELVDARRESDDPVGMLDQRGIVMSAEFRREVVDGLLVEKLRNHHLGHDVAAARGALRSWNTCCRSG